MASTPEKLADCRKRIAARGKLAVAVSGGVDSSFLLWLATGTLGSDNVLSLTNVGCFSSRQEQDRADRISRGLGVQHVEIRCDELADPAVASNAPDRCYHCKRALFGRFGEEARKRGFDTIASGTNADDVEDYRPGLRAEDELDVFRPLLESGLTKEEIRRLSREANLETWDLPSAACLASRIPYGQEITRQALRAVEQAETVLRESGFSTCRVRHHGTVARIEVPEAQLNRVIRHRERICAALKDIGFDYVALDLEGFRSGAMNEVLDGPDGD
jgi:uncharacterized protein